MASSLDFTSVIKHIVEGSFSYSLCRICLEPLDENCENIFTKVCKSDAEYCVADALLEVCQIKVHEEEDFSVCKKCYDAAAEAYKFSKLAKHNDEIINYYVTALETMIYPIEVPQEKMDEALFVPLPIFTPDEQLFDFDLSRTYLSSELTRNIKTELDTKQETNIEKVNKPSTIEKAVNKPSKGIQESDESDDSDHDDDKIVVVMTESGEPIFLKPTKNGELRVVTEAEKLNFAKAFNSSQNKPYEKKKKRKVRVQLEDRQCPLCPSKYRFLAKYREHMKVTHDVDIFVCPVCKDILPTAEEHNLHLSSHTDILTCAICNAVFKKRSSMVAHLKWHEDKTAIQKGVNICEMCGLVFSSVEILKDHKHKKHEPKYTCFYCGRMYRGEVSLDMHLKKHEHAMKKNESDENEKSDRDAKRLKKILDSKRRDCTVCGRTFVNERSLLWHSRLHTNERPFKCDVCGRGFVSLNRRNQHARCAHTAPTRQCPLCPALFHLTSMVNTHIKKVHLAEHKRRNRLSKHQLVYWRTEKVPLQELSVAVQSELLDRF